MSREATVKNRRNDGYKDGKPWNGAFSSFTKNEKGDSYINGKEVSLADFKQYCNIPENYLAVGVQKYNLK